ncbi:hypothetical protein [Cupriavidus plantarum]|uniref:hypothetical protein n=1 Tax=Cupriavidus plantarum TaxID=942865 RepID=UPI00178F2FD3|nr:hypothetical protein [Cupriavidus plantarum]NYI02784.1 hypothetical protein [Cupriavidus plantarum]
METKNRPLPGRKGTSQSAASQGAARTALAPNNTLRQILADKLLARVTQLAGDEGSSQRLTVALLDRLILDAADALNEDAKAQAPAVDALQAARDRGRHYALAELQRPENLSLRDAATYSGRSDRAINEARLKGQLYALVPPGKQRGLRYPQWQFDAEAERLGAVLALFIAAGASCWVVHNFMQRPLQALGDVRPMDWILDASQSVERVVEAVKNRYASEQGAA